MATRRGFEHAGNDDAKRFAPPGAEHRCGAPGCPFAGSLGSGGATWYCAYHYNIQPGEAHKVTSIIMQWRPLSELLVEGQKLLRDHPTDGASHSAWLNIGIQKFQQMTGREPTEFAPSRSSLDLGRFLYACQCFIGGEVQRVRVKRVKRVNDPNHPQAKLPITPPTAVEALPPAVAGR